MLAIAFIWMGLGDTRIGGLLKPLLGDAVGPGAAPNVAIDILTGILLAGAVWANLVVVRLLPFRFQVALVWIELVLLFVAFVDSFNRDLGVWFEKSTTGETNLAFLITTGAVTTLYVSLISILIACCLAMAAALARLSKSGPAYAISTFYTSFFRGTPLLLQVYLIYLGLPTLGRAFALDAVPSGIIALSLCYGAYMAEIFRAGILGVPHGQRDAAMALGLPPQPDLSQDHLPAGHAPHRAADRQPVHRHAQGFLAGLGDGRVGAHQDGADHRQARFPRVRDADPGGDHLLGHVDLLRADPVAHRGLLRQGLPAPLKQCTWTTAPSSPRSRPRNVRG